MPAPAAVYIIVAVVGAAAAAYALKEFVYEPHLSEKIEDLKNQARAFYLRKRAARGRTRAPPFHFADDNGDGDGSEIDADVELEGLVKSRGVFEFNHSSEIRLREDASDATVAAVATGVSPSTSRTTRNDGIALVHQDQQVRQRSVRPLVDVEETNLPDPIDLSTPSELTGTTTTTTLNPFLKQNLDLLNDGPALEPMQSPTLGRKIDHEFLANSNFDTITFSPLSQAHSLGVESPVILSPMTSPRSQTDTLAQEMSPSVFDTSSNNPRETPPRAASSYSVADLGSLISSRDSQHTFNREAGNSLSAPSRDLPNERGLDGPVTSLEMAWPPDDAISEASFTTNSSTLTSSTFTSSIESRVEEPSNGGPNPPLEYPHLESIEQSISSLGDAEWERLSDVDRRSPSPYRDFSEQT